MITEEQAEALKKHKADFLHKVEVLKNRYIKEVQKIARAAEAGKVEAVKAKLGIKKKK